MTDCLVQVAVMTHLVDLGEGFFWQPFWLHSKAVELLCESLPQYAITTLQLTGEVLKLKHDPMGRLQTTCFTAACCAVSNAITENACQS